MKTSDKIDLLSAAFVTAQAALKNVVFDKANPFFKSKYATLANVRDSVAPILSANGLAVIQGTCFEGGQFFFTSRMVHASGQWIESTYPLTSGKPQDMGSAITYARRYLLSAMCGISSEEDDDGNAAQAAKPKATEKPAAMPFVEGTNGASKAGNRAMFEKLTKEVRDIARLSVLTVWYTSNAAAIDAMPPDWVYDLRAEYSAKQRELKDRVAV